MASLGLRFDLLTRGARNAERDLEGVGGASGRAAAGVGRLGKALAVGLGGAAVGAVAGVGAALKGGLDEAISYQRITDQVAQTLKATGGAANVTVDQLKAYAGELESISGVDEELILSSQNVLATFTKIRNEAGKGNDVYNQASLAALNLSTTLGTSVAGAATQVGKALNDPLKGISALGKAGVSFTAQQKAQIKALTEAGDTLGAQKVILKELEVQYGGAAEAAGKGLGGSVARLKDTFADTFRDIATRALPTLTRLADSLAKNLPGAIATGQRVIGKVVKFIKTNVVPVLGDVADFVKGEVVPVLKDFAGFVKTRVVPALQDFGDFLTTKGIPALKLVGKFLGDQVRPVFEAFAKTVKESLLPSLRGLFQRIKDNKPQLITLAKVVAGIAAVVIIVARKIAEFLIPIIGKLSKFVYAAIGVAIGIVGALVRFGTAAFETGKKIVEFARGAIEKIRELFDAAKEKTEGIRGFLTTLGEKVIDIKDKVTAFVRVAVEKFGGLLGAVQRFLGPVIRFLQGVIDKAQAVKDTLETIPGLGGKGAGAGVGELNLPGFSNFDPLLNQTTSPNGFGNRSTSTPARAVQGNRTTNYILNGPVVASDPTKLRQELAARERLGALAGGGD